MDGSLFDAWTRRRFGLAAAGTATAILGITQARDAEAKKKRKKKRRTKCKKLFAHCTPGGRKCCHGNLCEAPNLDGMLCCKPENKGCKNSEECCPGLACFDDPPTPPYCKMT
jgi:hypothetical protein